MATSRQQKSPRLGTAAAEDEGRSRDRKAVDILVQLLRRLDTNDSRLAARRSKAGGR